MEGENGKVTMHNSGTILLGKSGHESENKTSKRRVRGIQALKSEFGGVSAVDDIT